MHTLTTLRGLIAALTIAGTSTGCAAYATGPVTGYLLSDVTGPVAATSNASATKVGTASCQSVLGLVASGDCSIAAAARQGGITRIHHVDHKSTGILGLFAKFTVVVYGE